MPKPVLREPFRPTLFTSEPPTNVAGERLNMIDAAIDIASSDSAFAAKLKEALRFILTAKKSTVPATTSLVPATAVIGSPNFVLHVKGTGFDPLSVIYFAGQPEPTTFVSATEVTTGVDMSVWHGADTLPVVVQNPSGAVSNPTNFTFTV